MNAQSPITADAPRLRGALASIIADPDCCAASKAIARDALTYHVNSASSDDMSCAEVFAAYPSWPLRLAAFRDTHLAACLASIRDDADRAGDAEWAYEAQYALDSGDLTELDDLIARDAEAEREAERAYRFECRTGREWVPHSEKVG